MQFFLKEWLLFSWHSLACEYIWIKPRGQETRTSQFRPIQDLGEKKKRKRKRAMSHTRLPNFEIIFPMQFSNQRFGWKVRMGSSIFPEQLPCFYVGISYSQELFHQKGQIKTSSDKVYRTQAFSHEEPPEQTPAWNTDEHPGSSCSAPETYQLQCCSRRCSLGQFFSSQKEGSSYSHKPGRLRGQKTRCSSQLYHLGPVSGLAHSKISGQLPTHSVSMDVLPLSETFCPPKQWCTLMGSFEVKMRQCL